MNALIDVLPISDIPELIYSYLSPEEQYELCDDPQMKKQLEDKYKRTKYNFKYETREWEAIDWVDVSHDAIYATYFNGKLHSFNDEPALVLKPFHLSEKQIRSILDRGQYDELDNSWYRFGELHREGDKPAERCQYEVSFYRDGQRLDNQSIRTIDFLINQNIENYSHNCRYIDPLTEMIVFNLKQLELKCDVIYVNDDWEQHKNRALRQLKTGHVRLL